MAADRGFHPDARLHCRRAREWASANVDAELSDVERRLLDRHLRGCADCAAFAAGLRATTALLRAAPPATPAQPFRLPERREASVPRARLVAALAAAALALGAFVGTLTRPGGEPAAPAPEVSLLSRDLGQLRELPRRPPPEPPRVRSGPPNPPEGVI